MTFAALALLPSPVRQIKRLLCGFAIGSLILNPAAVNGQPKLGTLTGDTSKPVLSTYILGEKVELVFKVSNLKTDSRGAKLQLSIVDEHDETIKTAEIAVTPDAGGNWETHVDAPAGRLGFYRVNAKLSNGVALQELGSRKAGFITYAVVPDPAQRVDYGEKESWFGMQGGFGPWGDQTLAYLGARWVLEGSFEWKRKEPDRAGQFDADAEIAKLKPKGAGWKKYPYASLFGAPQWAVIPDTFIYMTGTLTPEGEKAWDEYCRKAARVFSAKYPDIEEHIYQITWEPVRPWGYKGTDEGLVKIYEIAYKALHETDPKAVVAGPTQGLTEEQESITPLLKLGLWKYLDAYSVHPYFSITPERENMVRALRQVKNALKEYSPKPLPMIGSEQGYSTEEDPSKDIVQARGLVRQNLLTLGEGYRINFLYYITDYHLAGQKGYGYYYNLTKGVPFAPAKISPRPIVPAIAAQSLLIDGHQSVGAIEWLGETVWGYTFQRGDNIVVALWDYGDSPSEVTIPAGVTAARIYDWMGNGRDASIDNGNIALKLGPEPVYVTGLSPELWGKRSSGCLSFSEQQSVGYPGTPASIATNVRGPDGKAFKGTLTVSTDKRLGQKPVTRQVSLEEGGSGAFEVPIALPAETQPGRYPVQVVLKDDSGKSVAVSGLGLRVAPPISIEKVEPVAASQAGSGVRVVLKNERPAPLSGTLDFELRSVEGGARKLPFEIAGGGTQELQIVYPPAVKLSPTILYQANLMVTTSDGYSFSDTARLNFLSASRFKSKPALDANLSDWNGAMTVRLAGRPALIREPKQYSGESDLSGAIAFGWDEEALYVAADLIDDQYSQIYTGTDIWRGDAIQLAINLDPHKKEESASGNQLADVAERRRYSEITVTLAKNGVEAFRHLSFDPDTLILGPIAPNDLTAEVKSSGGKLIYEIAIPWRSLGLRPGDPKPKAGDMIGIAAALNDTDSNDEKMPAGLGLYGGIVPTKNPKKFGILVLGDASQTRK